MELAMKLVHSFSRKAYTRFVKDISTAKNIKNYKTKKLFERQKLNHVTGKINYQTKICYNPKTKKEYESPSNFCVYGVKYKATGDSYKVFDTLLINDQRNKLSDETLTLDHASQPLCDALSTATEKILYYGAWMQETQKTYIDVFLACCQECPHLDYDEWILLLKKEMIALSPYGLFRQNKLVFHKDDIFMFETHYVVANRTQEKLPACESSAYQLVPVKFGNRVGYAYASDRLDYETIYSRANAPPRIVKTSEIGCYSADVANKQNFVCKNMYSSEPYSDCYIQINDSRRYSYMCCCYGSKIAECQDQIDQAMVIGPPVDVILDEMRVCAVELEERNNFFGELSKSKIIYGGTVDVLLQSVQYYHHELPSQLSNINFVNCIGYLAIEQISKIDVAKMNELYQDNVEYIRKVVGGERNNRFSDPKSFEVDYNIPAADLNKQLNEAINNAYSFHCSHSYNWDIRTNDLLRFRCLQLLRTLVRFRKTHTHLFQRWMHSVHLHYHSMVSQGITSNVVVGIGPSATITCALILNFISSYTLLRASLEANGGNSLCGRNNLYHYVIHGYFDSDEFESNQSCLVHYASKDVLNDMDIETTESGRILFFLPGSAIQPIDFTYALLPPNQCTYVDVDLNSEYIKSRFCLNYSVLHNFETKYLPMRLYLCKCKSSETKPKCDVDLEKQIEKRFQAEYFQHFTLDASDSSSKFVFYLLSHQIKMKPQIRKHFSNILEKKYHCAKYSHARTLTVTEKPEIAVNEISIFCATVVEVKYAGDICLFDLKLLLQTRPQYVFSGTMAFRSFINYLKIDLSIIPHTTRTLSHEAISSCFPALKSEMHVCFCRNEKPESPCNLSAFERIRTLHSALFTWNNLRMIEFFPNDLLPYVTLKEPRWCQSKGLYSTIAVYGEKQEIISGSTCMFSTLDFVDEDYGIFCKEMLFFEECGIVMDQHHQEEAKLICCCVYNCDTIGVLLHTFRNHMENWLRRL
ncbi:unnamed protein product [Thelazia callipaeda]|uniref:SET domain-containing protein n=1 Tax=Thelazia callipaeda TaxID=103827 RepID=A0A158RAR9_THECL|nr:unnamed protein product [Thelazia callipaeda]